jgi:hypothetical protein
LLFAVAVAALLLAAALRFLGDPRAVLLGLLEKPAAVVLVAGAARLGARRFRALLAARCRLLGDPPTAAFLLLEEPVGIVGALVT